MRGNDVQGSFWSIANSNRCTYKACRQCTPWWDQVSHLSLGIREGWAYQLSICPVVQVAATADLDRMMQAGARMERNFGSMFAVCKWNANGLACFQEKILMGSNQARRRCLYTIIQTMILFSRFGTRPCGTLWNGVASPHELLSVTISIWHGVCVQGQKFTEYFFITLSG